MSTNYPTNLDTLTNPTSTDKLNSPSHADQHANSNDAIEALQVKVGADSSAITSTHDYKLSTIVDGDKSVSLTGTETLTNKTLTTPTITGLNISDEEFSVSDNADSTKEIDFELSGATTSTKTTITSSQTANRILTLPDTTDTLVGKATTDTLTNKTIDANGTGNSISNLEVADFTAAAVVTEGDGISSNDNDTTLPTSAAVKDYVDTTATGADIQTFTASGTWTKPGSGDYVQVRAWGAGGGGGADDGGGSTGGGGGAYIEAWFAISDLGATETVTIGSGGASSGTTSAAGGNTTFGSLLTAYGGGGGHKDTGGGGGGGVAAAGSSGDGSNGGDGGGILGGDGSTGAGGDSNFGGGAGGGTGSVGGASVKGGGGGAGSNSNGGNSIYAGGGGAGTGGSAGTSQFGGNGGAPSTAGSQPGGGGGVNASGANGMMVVTTIVDVQ